MKKQTDNELEELKKQIRLTVLHEIAHYLGFSEEELEEWEDEI